MKLFVSILKKWEIGYNLTCIQNGLVQVFLVSLNWSVSYVSISYERPRVRMLFLNVYLDELSFYCEGLF